jgi:micrococcal nuclease
VTRSQPLRRGALRAPLLIAVALLAVVFSRCGSDSDSAEPRGPVHAQVTDVIDGDTIEVRLPDGGEEDVRYIGIDTPETVKPDTPVQCGGPKAHAVNERLVGGRTVTLRFDEEDRDAYDRLLAYVYVPGAGSGGRPLFVNAELVRQGLARTLTIEPNDSFAALFGRLAASAGAAGRGLWGRCPQSDRGDKRPPQTTARGFAPRS